MGHQAAQIGAPGSVRRDSVSGRQNFAFPVLGGEPTLPTDFHRPPAGSDKCQPDPVDRWQLSGSFTAMADKIKTYIDHGVTIFELVIASFEQMGMMGKIAERVLLQVKRDPPAGARGGIAAA